MSWLYLYASFCFGALWLRINLDEGDSSAPIMTFAVAALFWPVVVPVSLAGVLYRRVMR